MSIVHDKNEHIKSNHMLLAIRLDKPLNVISCHAASVLLPLLNHTKMIKNSGTKQCMEYMEYHETFSLSSHCKYI